MRILVTGAAMVIARPQGHRDPDYLARLVEQEAVTTLHFVPSAEALLPLPQYPGSSNLL